MSNRFPAWMGWGMCGILLVAIYAIIIRAFEHDHLALWLDVGYMGAYVWLPGVVILRAARGESVGWVEAVALGFPVGYAVEIGSFLGMAAMGGREAYRFVPMLWALIAVWQWRGKFKETTVALGRVDPWVLAGLGGVLLATVVTAVSQLYLQAPLDGGTPATMTHHDWVYLISRAAEIKHRWPLEDPSMAGAPLSYHYFLLVHLAAASVVTGNELSVLLLRAYVLPLSGVLIAQAFFIGRLLTRRAWGGVLTAGLLMMTEEVSFVDSSQWGTFFNLFIRWLYLSPTFFFGMIFTGALVISAHRLAVAPGLRVGELLLLVVLAAAGTGAKGTVVPPLMVAMSVWAGLEIFRQGRLPWRQGVMLGAMSIGFGVVYFGAMAGWGNGGASFSPAISMKLAMFWQEHALAWTRGLQALGLSAGLSGALAQLACVAVIFAGSHGVRLIAVPYVAGWRSRPEPALVVWLALVWVVTQLFGNLIQLDSHSQLYLLFPGRLMLSSLAAAGLIVYLPRLARRARQDAVAVRVVARAAGRWGRRHVSLVVLALLLVADGWLIARGFVEWWVGLGSYVAMLLVFAPGRSALIRTQKGRQRPVLTRVRVGALASFVWRASPFVTLVVLLTVQGNHWRLRNESGFRLWASKEEPAMEAAMHQLQEGLHWLREHSPRDAVVIANAFTLRNLTSKTMAVVDRTTVDKYYYYSALAERRMWVEGPTYLQNQPEAQNRMRLAGLVFYHGAAPAELPHLGSSAYILIDRQLPDRAAVNLPSNARVFVNARIEIYRVPTGPTERLADKVTHGEHKS